MEKRDFKDAEVYLLRYQQCMTRSMALIRLYFIGVIKNLGQEVGRRLADQVRVFVHRSVSAFAVSDSS